MGLVALFIANRLIYCSFHSYFTEYVYDNLYRCLQIYTEYADVIYIND